MQRTYYLPFQPLLTSHRTSVSLPLGQAVLYLPLSCLLSFKLLSPVYSHLKEDLSFNFLIYGCLSVYMLLILTEDRRGHRFPGAGVIEDCEMPYGDWEAHFLRSSARTARPLNL